MSDEGTLLPGTTTFVASSTSSHGKLACGILSNSVIGGFGAAEETKCCMKGGDVTFRSSGRWIGILKEEAERDEGEARMDGWSKAMNLMSSTELFMTWKILLA